MSAARGNDHLNNRFKTTPMDRFFFVIYILINGQTVHYGTHGVPSSTGFKEYIKGKCRAGLLPKALRPVCGGIGIADARSRMVPMKRKRFFSDVLGNGRYSLHANPYRFVDNDERCMNSIRVLDQRQHQAFK